MCGKKATYGCIRKGKHLLSKYLDPYYSSLIQLYIFLQRLIPSKFNQTILKRLLIKRAKRTKMCISELSRLMKGKKGTAVFVGTITDDRRVNPKIYKKLKVCAIRFTKATITKITATGGQCLTFDQLALLAPKGSGCNLFRGRKNGFASANYSKLAPGVPGSHSRPRIRSSGRKHEMARGR